MKFNNKIKTILIILISTLALSACSTAKKTTSTVGTTGDVYTGDVYTGEGTIQYLATGVKDRVFFATNSSDLTTASRDTLRKQADWMRANDKIEVVLEGHADERGTRDYNLALGEKRANTAKDYLLTYGISTKRISVISYGKEKPVNSASTPLAWSQNRRAVTIKAK